MPPHLLGLHGWGVAREVLLKARQGPHDLLMLPPLLFQRLLRQLHLRPDQRVLLLDRFGCTMSQVTTVSQLLNQAL